MNFKYLFICLFFISSAHARLFFKVSLENKKGIDLGLILTSELHSMEEIIIGRPLLLRMKNGVGIELKTFWVEPESGFGPGETLEVKGRVFDKKNQVLKDFTKEPLFVHLGKETIITHEKEDQRIEIKITPELQ